LQQTNETVRRPLTTIEHTHELLRYEPDTGFFFWRISNGSSRAGDRAGAVMGSSGYRRVRLDGRNYREQRLAFFMMTGKWPDRDVDHINRIRSDNRWCNLRLATRSQSRANSQRNSRKLTNLPKGVFLERNKYVARMQKRYLGRFSTPDEASAAYYKAANDQFGEFALAA
jgi:hypothetical protein